MRIKSIKWYKPLLENFEAKCGCIELRCEKKWWFYVSVFKQKKFRSPKWICSVELGGLTRKGKYRSSPDVAKNDAENLIKELLLDIVNGTKQLIKQYRIEEIELCQ